MKDKDIEKSQQQENDSEKIHVSRSVFQSAKELEQQRRAEMEEQQKLIEQQAAEREKKKREAYERRLLEEKKELLRMKQEQSEESEIIAPEPEKEVKMTFGQKISNFFYHNKWWLGIGVLFAFIACFLIYDLVSRDDPDLVVMVVAENDIVGNSEGLKQYFESFIDDFNEDGEIHVSVYYIPYSDSYQKNYANGTDTKLTAEFQSANSMIVIGNEKLYNILRTDEVFVNLETLYPDSPHTDGIAFNLKDTDFAEKISVAQEALGDDMFIAFRIPQKLMYCDEEDMQEAYDKDFPVFDSIIKDLSS